MKSRYIIILAAVLLATTIGIAATFASSGRSPGSRNGTDMPGNNINMPGHDMNMPGHDMSMPGHNVSGSNMDITQHDGSSNSASHDSMNMNGQNTPDGALSGHDMGAAGQGVPANGMPGYEMDMSGHDGLNVQMGGHNMNMTDSTMSGHDMTGSETGLPQENGGQAMAQGGHQSADDEQDGEKDHGSSHGSPQGVHNTGDLTGAREVNKAGVLGGFGLVNGLIAVSAGILRRKNSKTGGSQGGKRLT